MTGKIFLFSLVFCLLPHTLISQEEEATIDQIARAIENHIERESKNGEGYLKIPFKEKELKLKLVRIHFEYLADLGNGTQFACVDLVDTKGPIYDVDFFLKRGKGGMLVTETTVHKINGQPIYTWKKIDEEGTWKRVPVEHSTLDLLGVVQGEDEFDFIYRFRIPHLVSPGKIWVPLAQTGPFQEVEIKKVLSPREGKRIWDQVYKNEIFYSTLTPEDSGKKLEIHYRVKGLEKSATRVDRENPEVDLGEEKLVPKNQTFTDICEKVTDGKKSDLIRARALYDHVVKELRYARYGEGWGKGDAVYACNEKSGNCTDFHSYFIALARSANIPARFIVGASIPSERDNGGVDGYHCWAEFYADGQWWPVDLSEANKNPSLATYFFGHKPANRLILSQGRDLILDPVPSTGPINFHAYPLIESEGKKIEVKTEFLFHRVKKS